MSAHNTKITNWSLVTRDSARTGQFVLAMSKERLYTIKSIEETYLEIVCPFSLIQTRVSIASKFFKSKFVHITDKEAQDFFRKEEAKKVAHIAALKKRAQRKQEELDEIRNRWRNLKTS